MRPTIPAFILLLVLIGCAPGDFFNTPAIAPASTSSNPAGSNPSAPGSSGSGSTTTTSTTGSGTGSTGSGISSGTGTTIATGSGSTTSSGTTTTTGTSTGSGTTTGTGSGTSNGSGSTTSGSGTTTGSGTSTTPILSPLYSLDTYYNAYGDSITAGSGLGSPSIEGFPALLSGYTSLSHHDYGIGNSQACDLSATEIFPNLDNPNLARPGLYTLLIGTNDADYRGPGPYEAVFNLCQQASIAWLALPAEDKILATSPIVTSAGATHLESTDWNALATDAQGATITFPLTLAATGPVYVWYRILDSNLGSFTTSLDGVVIASATTGTDPAIATANGGASSLALLRLPSLSAGSHSLTFTQTSAAAYGLGIVALGIPPVNPPSTMPQVYVGTTPPQLIGGGAPCDVNPTPCQAYTLDITNNVALLAADHLSVTLFNTGKYMTATPPDMLDPVHPNGTGNLQILHAIEDVLH